MNFQGAHNKNSWTKNQLKAIKHRTGRMVVLAGAGSGKTAVLAQRCAQLVDRDTPPCDVSELLVVTFTIEAAGEMRNRITNALRELSRKAGVQTEHGRRLAQQAALAPQARVSTVHAFCTWVLRTWFNLCGVDPAFGVLDEIAAELLWMQSFRDSVRRRLQTDNPGFKNFFDQYANGEITKLQQLIEPVVNLLSTLPDPDERLDQWRSAGDAIDSTIKFICAELGELIKELDDAGSNAVFAADPKRILADNLQNMKIAARFALRELEQNKLQGWDKAREKLAEADGNLKTAGGLKDDALVFKESVYRNIRDRFKNFIKNSPLIMSAADLDKTSRIARSTTLVLLDFISAAVADFRALKRARNQLDFSDLERLTVQALQKPDGQLAERLRRRFRHILFDEYQDINPLQQRLIELLARSDSSGSIFCVGDTAQSIYGFRGSRPELLQQQVDQIQTADRDGVVKMMENFRTLPPLIDAFNLIFKEIFTHAEDPNEPELRHGRDRYPENVQPVFTGAPLQLHVICKSDADGANQTTDNETDQNSDAGVLDASDMDDPIADFEIAEREALLAARMIRELLESGRLVSEKTSSAPPRPLQYDDIAVLMRSKKFRSSQVVRILGEQGIPAYAELTTGFFDSPEILEVLELLHVLDNPAQDIPLASVLLGPLGNFSHQELVHIRRAFPNRRTTAFHQAALNFSHDAEAAKQNHDLARRLEEFLIKLDEWRQILNALGIGEGLAHVYQVSGLLTNAAAQRDGKQKLANLHLLRQKALEYSASSNEGLSGFTAFLRQLAEIDIGAAPIPAPGAVKVMSIHAAKGLEFPVVFLIGLGTRFNFRNLSSLVIADADLGIGMQVFDATSGGLQRRISPEFVQVQEACRLRLIREEARLIYVAMTRARDHLVLIGNVPGTQNKAIEKWSRAASGADVNQAIDWLGPIFTDNLSAEKNNLLQLNWHDASTIEKENTLDTLRRKSANPNWDAVRAAQPLPVAPPQDPEMQKVINRITAQYRFQAQATQPALTTVSKLKTLAEDTDEFSAPSFDPSEEFSLQIQPASTGIRRGTATHIVLQQLDLTADLSLAGIRVQIEKLISSGQIPPNVAAAADADADGIAWFFTTTPGKQMREIAMKKARGDNGAELLREQVFLWSQNGDASGFDPSDAVLVRGAIDVLLIDGKNVRIIDYKTDASAMIESRLPAYRKQVQYYARAAGDILKIPITTATLVFLSARRCEEVDVG